MVSMKNISINALLLWFLHFIERQIHLYSWFIYCLRQDKNYAPRFHPHKIPLPLLRCSAALSHTDSCRVLQGKGSANAFCHDGHDIDRKPGNALFTARVEAELGIRATYYFRRYGSTFRPGIMTDRKGRGHRASISARCCGR